MGGKFKNNLWVWSGPIRKAKDTKNLLRKQVRVTKEGNNYLAQLFNTQMIVT